MKKIVSTIYKNASIQFSDELVVFENGKAEVKDETWESIKTGGFPGVALEEEAEKLEKEKTEAEKDTDEALKVLKEEYEFQIERLNSWNSLWVYGEKRSKDCLTVVNRKKSLKTLSERIQQPKKKLLP